MSQKPAIRVRSADGKPRAWKAIHAALGGQTFLRVYAQSGDIEFLLTADNAKQIDGLREKLAAAGVEEIVGGDTTKGPKPKDEPVGATPSGPDLNKKPYGFVALPNNHTTSKPIWHDGTTSKGRLSGEVRFELETLTPLLVGWERGLVGDNERADWPIESRPQGRGQSMNLDGQWSRPVAANKSVLCPLRAPWGKRPVIIPGDSLKGLLRHELGALLGAPMERVAERSYSYRPNALFPNEPGARLVARLARVPNDGVKTMSLDGTGGMQVRVLWRLEMFPADLEYNRKANRFDFRFDQEGGFAYRGGQGAGEDLNSKRKLHHSVTVLRDATTETADVPEAAQDGYLATLRHLVDLDHGHFSERHPDVPNGVNGDDAKQRILQAATNDVFQPGDIVWVEWDAQKNCIVSLGWHYYYRWAYTDSIRRRGGTLQRYGLFPLATERERDDDGAPAGLSAVRRLFGYTGDNDGSEGIGEGDHEQLMGRLFPNAAVEVVESGDNDASRFLKPTFLKELGMPRPSAVEHYLKQPHHPKSRPSDRASLVTYGDAAGYDAGGELAGRKFYLDRTDAYSGEPWEDPDDQNRLNDRSTLALDASRPGRRFRFTIRFQDLDPTELAAVLASLCPNQFRGILGGTHGDGYCSKLGYARPLGWGSVRIEAKALLWLDVDEQAPTLTPEVDLTGWVRQNHVKSSSQDEWLAIHRRNHPHAADYPRDKGEIFTFHTTLRAKHSRARRYRTGNRA